VPAHGTVYLLHQPAQTRVHRRTLLLTIALAFTAVGAYPAGQEDYDLLRGDDPAEVARARERIAALGAPPSDPVGGDGVASWY
jgi:uncharacterized protein YjlB